MAKFYVQGKDGKECLGKASDELKELSFSDAAREGGLVYATHSYGDLYVPSTALDIKLGYAVEGWVER